MDWRRSGRDRPIRSRAEVRAAVVCAPHGGGQDASRGQRPMPHKWSRRVLSPEHGTWRIDWRVRPHVIAIAQKWVICACCDLEGDHGRTTHTRQAWLSARALALVSASNSAARHAHPGECAFRPASTDAGAPAIPLGQAPRDRQQGVEPGSTLSRSVPARPTFRMV
jgi:hypothetical protein